MELLSNSKPVYFNTGLAQLPALMANGGYSKVFVLTDEHTSVHCLPVFQQLLDDFTGFDLIETSAGEENKSIDFCIGIWKTLLDFGADRKCLLINLGGGVITDMGGFIAATYKRGVDFVNIPTSLLAQVDASVGGKTGIDVDNAKNMVGTFSIPIAVFIEDVFLKTLPEKEMRSGSAEVLKHGLIADAAYFKELNDTGLHAITAAQVYRSVEIKNTVVTEDPLEKGLRKILNFGHTIGHALESYSLSNDKTPLTHGDAIAIGMICESYLSFKINN
ncbi:MAG: 3-dehydroquinate synthase [Pedobacter sp.]|nr:MAG: 3-dehydroquinate synthase [Pedobacter sp.]